MTEMAEPGNGVEGQNGNVEEVGDGNYQHKDIGDQSQDRRQQDQGQQGQDVGQQDGNHRQNQGPPNQGGRSRCKTFTVCGFVALLAASIPAALQVYKYKDFRDS